MNPEYLLYTADQVQALDRIAIEASGIPGYTLMTRAAAASLGILRNRWPQAQRLLVLCGSGNNGGDGLVLARLALQAGFQVRVVQMGDPDRIRGDAATARKDWLAVGGQVMQQTEGLTFEADVIVDALLGTGFSRPLAPDWQALIVAVNDAAVPVIALDIPSGLSADTGQVAACAVRADVTVTFIARKCGQHAGNGPAYCGEIVLDTLEVPAAAYQQVTHSAVFINDKQPNPFPAARTRTAHKGCYGYVLVVGGDHGMSGAVQLAGLAALRGGAGRVSVATRAEHAALIAAACPELMCHGIGSGRELKPLLAQAGVVVIGPGLGQTSWAQSLLSTVLETGLPLVVDADALNLMAREPVSRDHWILTPHPGEAARLLAQTVAEVQADRLTAVRLLQQQWGGVSVLKGAGTLVYDGQQPPAICTAGNPGMATAGMGDVLSGITGALVAQQLTLSQAASAAVCLHACAGDVAAEQGERGLLARDVIAALPGLLQD